MPTLLRDPQFLVLAVCAVTLLGISKGGFIGLGVSAVPLLSLVMPPPQAAAILLPILLAQDAVSVWVYHRDFSAWNLKVLLAGATIGMVASTLLAASLSSDVVKLAVGVIAVLFVVSRLAAPWIEHHLPKPNAVSGLVWGTVAGFTSAIANAGSPPYQIHMLPQRLPKMTFVGTTALYFAATNLMKIPSYAALGQLTWVNMLTGIALIPLAVATNFLGVYLVRRVSMAAFYRIAYVLIFALGCELIRSAASALWR
ncbi:MAG TPA: sulfite exporter TauE/SafE family protein [Pseudolabrys sp.]|nr:sulfite exporter TauE/SafE family protein [Pseudolabrys sp.]